MNSLNIEEVVYLLQDLLTEKRVKTFSKFLSEVRIYFNFDNVEVVTYKFIYKELKNIHAFLKEMQHHPNSHVLAQALKPTFIFLLNNFIIPRLVNVYDAKFLQNINVKYVDLIGASLDRRITQLQGDQFYIPYKGIPLSGRSKNFSSFARKSWLLGFSKEKIVEKLVLTQLRCGRVLFNPTGGWSGEEARGVARLMAQHHHYSDSYFFPLEIFKIEEEEDLPEGW